VFRELGSDCDDRTYLMRERLEDGRSETFAAKVLERGSMADVSCLLQDITKQCSLNHVNIVRLLEVILTSSHLLIKLEYAAGGELHDYIVKQHSMSQSQQLSEEHARFFFKQLLDAVVHCHEHGVTHGGIELSRILLDGGKIPRVKVCNFDLSRNWGETDDYKSCITMEAALYMPPEMVKNILHRTEMPLDATKTDVWSLGVILFMMLLGRFPFSSQRCAGGIPTRLGSHLTTMQDSDFRLLLRSMVKSHRADLTRLKSDVWGASKLSADCRRLLDAMFAMDPAKRIGLEAVRHHPWVSGPLFLEHAQTIAACWDEMDQPHEDSGKLKCGSEEEEELKEVVHAARKIGSPKTVPVRWTPPAAKLSQGSCTGLIARGEFIGDFESPTAGDGV